MLTKIWVESEDWHGYRVKDGDYLTLKKLNFFIGVNNSGKSRFIRQVMTEVPTEIKFATVDCDMEVYQQDFSIAKDASQDYSALRKALGNPILNLLDSKIFTLNEYSMLSQLSEKWRNFWDDGYYPAMKNLEWQFNQENNRQLFTGISIPNLPSKFYIPVLRGLRPFDSKTDRYKQRTEKDYFQDNVNIVTGHDLYELLVKYLLGLPEDRAKVRAFEQKLGEVFFEGQEVVLIPEHGKDTVAVKIGEEDQHAIYNLGDGLQQVIIITSHAFLNQEASMYCIEEPEVHMHPGLLRRLAEFLAEETPHQYLMTTHSNHLFDLADDRDDVAIHRVRKTADEGKPAFEICEVSKDKELLMELGVKPSSVYLANCTLWVEGVTDRLYIRAFLKRYLQLLEEENSEQHQRYAHYNENYHYAFVEYQGGVLSHWCFDDAEIDSEEIEKLSAESLCSEALLIADGDIKGKSTREADLQRQLGDRLIVLDGKEIENYLPLEVIQSVVKTLFKTKRGKAKEGVDIELIAQLEAAAYENNLKDGIGRVIDQQLEIADGLSLFSEDSGTIKGKVNFCLTAVAYMNNNEWEMPDRLKAICQKIFEHVDGHNQGN